MSGYATRLLLLDNLDHLYRLSLADFERMRKGASGRTISQFASETLRAAQVEIALQNRRPAHVLGITTFAIDFDDSGRMDRSGYEKAQQAVAVNALDAVSRRSEGGSGGNTSSSSVCYRGSWKASERQLEFIYQAALGRISCRRL